MINAIKGINSGMWLRESAKELSGKVLSQASLRIANSRGGKVVREWNRKPRPAMGTEKHLGKGKDRGQGKLTLQFH